MAGGREHMDKKWYNFGKQITSLQALGTTMKHLSVAVLLITLIGCSDDIAVQTDPQDAVADIPDEESRLLQTLTGHSDSVYSVSFSPDGKRIVSGGTDKTLKVWDAETGQEMLTLTGHSDSVISVVFSPNGRRIISGSHDKTVKIWDARPPELEEDLQKFEDNFYK